MPSSSLMTAAVVRTCASGMPNARNATRCAWVTLSFMPLPLPFHRVALCLALHPEVAQGSGQGQDVLVREVGGADSAHVAAPLDTHVGNSGRQFGDVVGLRPPLAGTVSEHHVHLDRVVEAHRNSRREQVTPADDVLAGVLDCCDHRDPDRAALSEEQPEGVLDPPDDGPLGEGAQRGELVDDDHQVRAVHRRTVDDARPEWRGRDFGGS